MNAITRYAPKAPAYRQHVASHKRAMRRPMVGINMTADPAIPAGTRAEDWRKCQYAAWIADRDRLFRFHPNAYAAVADGDAVHFEARAGAPGDHAFSVTLPALEWCDLIDADLAAIADVAALPAPDAAPRCTETPDAFEAPAALPAPVDAVACPAPIAGPDNDAVAFVRSRRRFMVKAPAPIAPAAPEPVAAPVAAPAPVARKPRRRPQTAAPALPAPTLPAEPKTAAGEAPAVKRVHFLVRGRLHTVDMPAG